MQWSLHVITGFVVMPILLGGYWLLWPYHPITETAPPVSMAAAVPAGDTWQVGRSVCVHAREAYRAHRIMVGRDGGQIVLPHEVGVSRVGCYYRLVAIDIPAWVPAGVYEYRASLSYDVNPLRTVVVDMMPVRIEVTR